MYVVLDEVKTFVNAVQKILLTLYIILYKEYKNLKLCVHNLVHKNKICTKK